MDRLINSGVWLYPICVFGLYKLFNPRAPDEWMAIFSLAILPVLYFSFLGDKPKPEQALKKKAMYPQIDKRLLFKKPTGIVFGKDKNKYVCWDLQNDAHCLIIGGSGSGKSSSCAIPTLLTNPNVATLALDIKGELSLKSTKYNDPRIRIVNPLNRSTWGYDVFFKLNKNPSEQNIAEVMEEIAISLIPLDAKTKDKFWILSARSLFEGLLIYYLKEEGKDFIEIIDEILGRPIEESVKKIIGTASPDSAEYKALIQFYGMPMETLSGVYAELASHLKIFANDQNIRFALQDNFNKVCPKDLLKGKSIFLHIPEHKLEAYSGLILLMINQTMKVLEEREEREDNKPILIMLDEISRIVAASGKLDSLIQGSATLRSKKCRIILIMQSIESALVAYSKEQMDTLVSNCGLIYVLDATTAQTQRDIAGWCGKYQEQQKNYQKEKGMNQYKASISFVEKDIVTPKDLRMLAQTGEAILISPYGYFRFKKAPYFKDKKMKEQVKQNVTYNKSVL